MIASSLGDEIAEVRAAWAELVPLLGVDRVTEQHLSAVRSASARLVDAVFAYARGINDIDSDIPF